MSESSHQLSSALRFTETNSAEDSQGKTWGLEGNLFWFLVGGVFAAVMLLLMCFSVLHWGLGLSLAVAFIPLTLSLVYVFGFRHGKPAGYDRDFVDHLFNGAGFAPCTLDHQPPHPFL
jgi:Flp pilus assembly protein TadB